MAPDQKAPTGEGPAPQPGPENARPPAPFASALFARVACFAFITGVMVAAAVVAAFLHAERSALRRTDADALGLAAERTVKALSDRLARRPQGLDDVSFEILREEVARLSEERGVIQAALVVEGGREVISAQSREATAEHGGVLPVPDVAGPGRTLAADFVTVVSAFPLQRGDVKDSLLVVKAGYPTMASRMRDLIALGGRAVGLTALGLLFLLPLVARFVFRSHGVAAGLAEAGEVPEPARMAAGGVELMRLCERIEGDAGVIAAAEKARRDLGLAAKEELAKMRERVDAARRSADEAKEEARSATAAKANFVANTSHEIRTPLHAVLGTTSLLLESELDQEQRALAERSLRASNMLLSLVDDVLDLARFDAREITLETRVFDPGALAEEVAELGAPLAAARGLDMTSFVPAECPRGVVGDPVRIRQALMRLVDNAIKFTDTGEVTVDVAWEASEDGLPRAVFSVADTGIGIGEAERSRLFQAFEQIDGSNTRRHGGVGLGLALVARIARASGGEVRLASQPGQGARFALALPLEMDRAEARGLAERITSRRTPLEGLRVLVLDDAYHGGQLFGRTLEILGARAHVDVSTYAGFETFMAGHFDAVFIDAQLAGRDAFLGALAADPERSHVPVILMTPPHAGQGGQPGLHDQAVAAMIAKPLSRADIEEVTLRVLGRGQERARTELADSEGAERRKALLDSHIRRRLRILLVEDNPTNQQLVQYILGKRGYQVDVASNGRRAVDAFTVGKYDAVLMDCQMPEMDGYEATRRLRDMEEGAGRRTPILAMTASVLDSDRDKCERAGMDDMLSKPFQPHRMVEWLEGWLLRTFQQSHGFALEPEEPEARVDAGASEVQAAAAEVLGDAPGAPARRIVGLEHVPAVAPAIAPAEDRPSVGALLSDGAPAEGAVEGAGQLSDNELRAAVDTDVLGALLCDEEGRILASELIDSFLAIAPERLAALETAASRGELAECASIAHGLVSTSGTVGAVRLAKMLRDVERFARSGNSADSIRLVASCRSEVETARLALIRTVGEAPRS